MKRVFPVVLALGLLVLGMSALADKGMGDKPMTTTTTTTTKTETKAAHDGHVMKMSALTWKDMDGYPAGCKTAEVCAEGGVSSAYAKFPKGTKVAAHTHTGAHWGTMVSGNGTFGFGIDPAKGTEIAAGDFIHVPANAVHWLNAKSDVVVFIAATGEPGINYVNPADDPRKGQAVSK